MSFNSDPTKPAEEIRFSQKRILQELEIKHVSEHIKLGYIFDSNVNCAAHFKEKSAQAEIGMGIIEQLREYLPTYVLDEIYTMHDRSHFCDFIDHIPELR